MNNVRLLTAAAHPAAVLVVTPAVVVAADTAVTLAVVVTLVAVALALDKKEITRLRYDEITLNIIR